MTPPRIVEPVTGLSRTIGLDHGTGPRGMAFGTRPTGARCIPDRHAGVGSRLGPSQSWSMPTSHEPAPNTLVGALAHPDTGRLNLSPGGLS